MSGICSCITAPITVPTNCRYHCSRITRAITDLLPETTASAPHSGTMYSGRCCPDDLGHRLIIETAAGSPAGLSCGLVGDQSRLSPSLKRESGCGDRYCEVVQRDQGI